MNKNVIIVLAGGVLVAVLVAVLMGAMLGGKDKKAVQVVDRAPRVEVLVAKAPISETQRLSGDNMMWKKWPQDGTFPGTIKRKGDQSATDAAEGRVNRDIAQGEPILKSALVSGSSSYVAATLEEGMRAVAIRVGATTTAGGFVGPGDYVDVMLTYRQKIDGISPDPAVRERQKAIVERNVASYAVETILQNVKVLAVDQSVSRDEDKVRVGKTVTLEVTPRQAEVLAVIDKAGDLSLALRGVGDDKPVVSEGPIVTDERMTNLFDEMIMEFEKSNGGGATEGVKIYSGGSVESVIVQ